MIKNRLDDVLQRRNLLSIYLTAGFPKIGSLVPLCEAIGAAGGDLIEIGFPFSDPVADGPVIQHSSSVALANGMCVAELFRQLAHIRSTVRVPLILMGYLNPVLQFGVERFYAAAAEVGVDGVLIPDLPLSEYLEGHLRYVQKNNLHFIFLVTPNSSPERIREIDAHSTGFIYAVAAAQVTGGQGGKNSGQDQYFQRLREMKLKHPILIGFGIHDRRTFQNACQYAAGAIVGSAYIKTIAAATDSVLATTEFINCLR